MPVGKIWGVGQVTEKALKSRGIHTIGQLRQSRLEELQRIVGNGAADLQRLARGEDDRDVEPDRQCKSLSSEQTFATDISDATILLAVLLEQVEEVAQRLRQEKLKARTVTLKLRYGDFRTVTRSDTLSEATNVTKTLWATAEHVFRQWHARSGGPLRLLGFGVSGLSLGAGRPATALSRPRTGETQAARPGRGQDPRPLRQARRPPRRIDS